MIECRQDWGPLGAWQITVASLPLSPISASLPLTGYLWAPEFPRCCIWTVSFPLVPEFLSTPSVFPHPSRGVSAKTTEDWLILPPTAAHQFWCSFFQEVLNFYRKPQYSLGLEMLHHDDFRPWELPPPWSPISSTFYDLWTINSPVLMGIPLLLLSCGTRKKKGGTSVWCISQV